MKKLQELCLAGVFTFALTTATFAGEIPTGGKTEPPPPPVPASATASGEITTDPNDNESDELLENIVPDLLLIVLSVF
jgi:hypothetical protein